MEKKAYDVVICGGGLAGQTLARQLKQSIPDISLLLIDRLSRPLPAAVFKVGESTNEVGAHYLTHILNLEEYFHEIHPRKLGLRYFFGNSRGPLHARPEFGLSKYAAVRTYQIDRGVLENDLRMFNSDAGIELAENCSVHDIILSRNSDLHEVYFTRGDDVIRQIARARWVVDAMGRRRLLQKKLGLTIEDPQKFSSAWFRLEGRIDIDDLVPASEAGWHNRVPGKLRYFSTNHLMGNGYWVWLIALSSGNTSIGIVADEDIHDFAGYNTYEKAMDWLREHEPVLAAHISECAPMDFKLMRRYSYASEQVFSRQRWSCVGEAGVFSDPFYSPGTDQIGFANSITVDLISRDIEGKLTDDIIDEANFFFLAYNDSVTRNIHLGYPFFGSALVMGTKLLWDFMAGWAFSGPLLFSRLLVDRETSAKVHRITGKFVPLADRVQKLLADWSQMSTRSGSYDFLDYLSVPFIRDLRTRNLEMNKTPSQVVSDHIASMETAEEMAQAIFLLAIEDTMPEKLVLFPYPVWINAWAISLDPGRWRSDKLFEPSTRPRDLRVISEQLRRHLQF